VTRWSRVAIAALDRIANPAGLDLGAREAGDVAVSILAQIIARRNAVATVVESTAAPAPRPRAALPVLGARAPAVSEPAAPPDHAIDPVCQMTVAVGTARHVGTWDQRTWYFCCAGCKSRFLADPAKYAPAVASDLAR